MNKFILSITLAVAALCAPTKSSSAQSADDPTPASVAITTPSEEGVLEVEQPVSGPPLHVTPPPGTRKVIIKGARLAAVAPATSQQPSTAATVNKTVDGGESNSDTVSSFGFAAYSRFSALGEETSLLGGIRLSHGFKPGWDAEVSFETGFGSCPGVLGGIGGGITHRVSEHVSLGGGLRADWCVDRDEDSVGNTLEERRRSRFVGVPLSLQGQWSNGWFVRGEVEPGVLGTPVQGDIEYQKGVALGALIGHMWGGK